LLITKTPHGDVLKTIDHQPMKIIEQTRLPLSSIRASQ
jgi:hypothetical protein